MADFPPTISVQPMSQPIDERAYGDSQARAHKRPPPQVSPEEESGADEPEDGQQKHQLDLDA